MNAVLTTKLSSKGQVVLPEAVRDMFGWDVGTSFSVMVYKGSIIMKPLVAPTPAELDAEFADAFAESAKSARDARMPRSAIDDAVRAVHASSRARRSSR